MNIIIRLLGLLVAFVAISCQSGIRKSGIDSQHLFNGSYSGEYLNHIAFPIGGIGAGMVCLEGTGTISHVSVYNKPDIFNEPNMFAALSIKGLENGTKVLEGPVPDYKKFSRPGTGRGAPGTSYGLPRFENAEFEAHFPFGKILLRDDDIPLDVIITGWSPFIPLDPDNSSLPCGALEYIFVNHQDREVEALFSFNTDNFMHRKGCFSSIKPISNGFILSNEPPENAPYLQGDFAFFTPDENTLVDHCWFRGIRQGYDAISITWEHLTNTEPRVSDPVDMDAPGASLYVPFILKPGEEKKIRLMLCWYNPHSELRYGEEVNPDEEQYDPARESWDSYYHQPWYSSCFKSIQDVSEYWLQNYDDLKMRSEEFTESFYNTTLPDVVVEAIAANLTILKSPTVLRDDQGRLYNFEGCDDNTGLGPGTNTHVWNYAQAIPHLFPSLERTLRETEFLVSQDETGHQTFNAALPIRIVGHEFYAAADGQLGGIMKVYREWRISGNDQWLKKMYPAVKMSMDYCIREWDPRETGALEEPQHNTFDIRFWGPNGMCTGFYLGALKAFIMIGEYLGEDVRRYQILLDEGEDILENELFNGNYFIQKIQWEGLSTPSPLEEKSKSKRSIYSDEAIALVRNEGPFHQYGNGCLSGGIMGTWMAKVCGIEEEIVDGEKVRSHLESVYRYNFKSNLHEHVNPHRPGFAMGHEGGLLNCTWPKGDKLSLPFVYSHEVWTGVEYQVASQLMFAGENKKALDIVRACRKRYDGSVRNPFDEYEWGHWYGRAMASYAMIQALTGVRYDAVSNTLFIDSNIGDNFDSFFSCQTGWGNIGLDKGIPYVKMASGNMDIQKCIVSGEEIPVTEIIYLK